MDRRTARAQSAADDPPDATDGAAVRQEPDASGPRPGRAAGDPDSEWDRRRREILEAAAEVFFHKGFDRGTTKEVAARVGLTQPAIYHYVGSKQDLIIEIARQVDNEFSEAMAGALSTSSDPVEQLRSVVYAFTDALSRNRLSFALYWKEYRAIPPNVAKSVSAHHRTFIEQFSDLVRKSQALGALPADQPTEIVSQGLLGMLSWTYWWYRPDGPSSPADIARGFLALVGLLEPSEGKSTDDDGGPAPTEPHRSHRP
jgi:AcrR family transcriptional regulator